MRNLGEMALLRSPDFFQVFWVLEIPRESLGIRAGGHLGDSLFLVEFGDGELADPEAEPIGVFGDGKGDRQYIWRDSFWGEADVKLLDRAPDSLRAQINPPRAGITMVSRLLYRLDRGDGGWNGGAT